jgi:hypothetical protein
MRWTRYPSAGPASTKKEHPAKINPTKKLASGPAFTRCKPRLLVKFFPLYDTNKVYAFSRQSSRSGGLCGCQPTQYQPNDIMTNTEYLAKMDQLATEFPMADMMAPSIRRKVEDSTISKGELTMARHAMPHSLVRQNRPLFIEGSKAFDAAWSEWIA